MFGEMFRFDEKYRETTLYLFSSHKVIDDYLWVITEINVGVLRTDISKFDVSSLLYAFLIS